MEVHIHMTSGEYSFFGSEVSYCHAGPNVSCQNISSMTFGVLAYGASPESYVSQSFRSGGLMMSLDSLTDPSPTHPNPGSRLWGLGFRCLGFRIWVPVSSEVLE